MLHAAAWTDVDAAEDDPQSAAAVNVGGVQHAAELGVPLARLAVPASGLLALAGGLSVLAGYHTRLGAWLLVAFLVPVTVMMHAFWRLADPVAVHTQQAMFMKNVAMIGAALLIACFGGGPWSLDARLGR